MFSETIRTALRLLEEKHEYTLAKLAQKRELLATLEPSSSQYRTVSRKIQYLNRGVHLQVEELARMQAYLTKRILCESPTTATSPIVVCESLEGLNGDTQRP
jgi:Arc/MetJ-type ribon-helix-helix transcriptional regulator